MIDFQADGRITLDLDDGQGPLEIRRPTYGQFMAWQLRLSEIVSDLQKYNADMAPIPRARVEGETPTGPDEADLFAQWDAADAEQRLAWQQLRNERGVAASREIARHLIGFWHLVIDGDPSVGAKGAGSRKLSGSDDDLPAFLVMSMDVVNEAFAHWRDTPLARGGQAQLVPVT